MCHKFVHSVEIFPKSTYESNVCKGTLSRFPLESIFEHPHIQCTDPCPAPYEPCPQAVSGYLAKAKALGLRNILALRGDLPNIDEEWQVGRCYWSLL